MQVYRKKVWLSIGLLLAIIAGIGFTVEERMKTRKFKGDEIVQLVKSGKSYLLLRNKKPYNINGAAVYDCTKLKQLKECGANSVRIYDTKNAKQILDSAYKLGLTVILGLKLGYAYKDLDYGSNEQVAAQLQTVKEEVLKYKDHPALLMWCIGNELSLFLDIDITAVFKHIRVWMAVNDIANMIHQVDPNHLTTTALQQGRNAMLFVSIYCNGIDVVSVNAFDPFGDIKKRINYYLYNKPYMITEFGAKAYWLMPKTEWFAFTEQSSRKKAQYIEEQYYNIKADSAICLGSYVFFWGYRYEYTPTLFSLFTDHGEPTECIDVIQKMWSGYFPLTRAPSIHSLKIHNKNDVENIYLERKKLYQATLVFDTASFKSLELRWEVRKDDIEYLDASYDSKIPKVVASDSISLSGIITKITIANSGDKSGQLEFDFITCKERGPYRLYIYLRNGYDKVATINGCFYVQ